MNAKTYFFRNINNMKELIEKNNIAINKNKEKLEYLVIETIELENKDYIQFINKLHNNYYFLYDYIEKMKIDENGIWRCIKVMNKETGKSILVQNDGYSYPRFVAIENID